MRLFRLRTLPFPTPLGWLIVLLAAVAPFVGWWYGAESFFATTCRLPAKILVLEAWTGRDAADAAAREFLSGSNEYQYLVVVGGRTGHSWDRLRWSLTDIDGKELRADGVPWDRLILVPVPDSESLRTYAMAMATRRALEARHLPPTPINVFTLGAHARRSRLIFSRAFHSSAVGVIAWRPDGWLEPWWHSSERAEDLVKETVGYPYELLFDSGRPGN